MRPTVRSTTIAACIAICSSASAHAQAALIGSAPPRIVTAAGKARIDAVLQKFVNDGSVAGVSALVFEQGREVYFNAFGMADREAGRPMARDAIVQIYSMTKPITGVALMTLFEQGKFKLDDPLAKYLPEFGNMQVYAGTDAGGKPVLIKPHRAITIRDITRHTAGFATGTDNPGVGPLLRAADPSNRNNTLAQMAAKLANVPLWFHPGEKWAYGPSVDVQAYLVERLSGQPFEQYIQQHILTPLHMRETRYFVPESDRGRFAALYQRSDGGVLTHDPDSTAHSFNTKHWPLTPGSYGLTATIDDYMRFARLLQNGGELDGVRILKPETIKLMATSHLADSITDRSWLPSKGSVGFGIDFAVRTRPPANRQENYGEVGEFFWDGAASTLFWVDPVNKLTAVLFVQLMPFDRVGLHKGFRDAVYGARSNNANMEQGVSIERLDAAIDALIPPNAKIEELARGFSWSEGPAWRRASGDLLFSDVPRNTIYRYKDGEGVSVFMRPSGFTGPNPPGRELGSNGLTIDALGKVVMADHGNRQVARLDDSLFTKTTIADRFGDKRFNSPNDLAFRSNGDLYFTDPPFGLKGLNSDPAKELKENGIYRVTPGGAVSLLTAELEFPNGIAFSPDERTLYVSNADANRAIWMAYTVNADGSLSAGRVLFDATPLAKQGRRGVPDGMRVDRHGNLFAAGPGGILVISPQGKHLGTIVTGQPTANCAFGDDGSTLYITANDRLLRIRLTTKGAGL